MLYVVGQKADTILNISDVQWLFFFFLHYQGAKGDRGMTGDAGEKGEQVKTECVFQQCHHCDCSFINNSCDVCRGIPFSEAEEEDGSSSSLINFK